MDSTTQPNNPYAGVTLVAAPGMTPQSQTPYGGVTNTPMELPHTPISIPNNPAPSIGEQALREGYAPLGAINAGVERTVGGIAGSGAHIAGAAASDLGLAAPGAGARWDAATQQYFTPPAPLSAAEEAYRNAPGRLMRPLTAGANAAGEEFARNMPAGVNHVVNDYVAPAANLAAGIAGGGEAEPEALEEGLPGTEGAVAKGTNDVARAAELGISPGISRVAADQGAGAGLGALARIAESASGSGPFANEISIRNAPRVNAGVNYDLGIPAGQVTSRQAILDGQVPLKAGFNRMQQVPGQIQMDPMFQDDMNGIGNTLHTLPSTPDIDKLRTIAGNPGAIDAPTLIKTSQEARSRGSQLMDSDDPQQVALGKAYLGTARAYENQFGRYLQQNPQLGVSPDEWAQLRQGWAKNQLALTAYKGGETGGSYDAKVFGNAAQAGEPLTGWMRVIGNEQPGAKESFKLNAPPPNRIIPFAGSGVGSLVGAGALLGGHPMAGLQIAGAMTGLDAVRAGLRRVALGPVLTPAQASERAAAIAQDPRLSYFFAARDQGRGFAPQPSAPEPQQGALPLGTPLNLQAPPGEIGGTGPMPHGGAPINGPQGEFNGMNNFKLTPPKGRVGKKPLSDEF